VQSNNVSNSAYDRKRVVYKGGILGGTKHLKKKTDVINYNDTNYRSTLF